MRLSISVILIIFTISIFNSCWYTSQNPLQLYNEVEKGDLNISLECEGSISLISTGGSFSYPIYNTNIYATSSTANTRIVNSTFEVSEWIESLIETEGYIIVDESATDIDYHLEFIETGNGQKEIAASYITLGILYPMQTDFYKNYNMKIFNNKGRKVGSKSFELRVRRNVFNIPLIIFFPFTENKDSEFNEAYSVLNTEILNFINQVITEE